MLSTTHTFFSGPPDEELDEAAEAAWNVVTFIAIAVEEGASYSWFRDIVFPPSPVNFLAIPSFEDFRQHERFLYHLLCGENCLAALSWWKWTLIMEGITMLSGFSRNWQSKISKNNHKNSFLRLLPFWPKSLFSENILIAWKYHLPPPPFFQK